MPVELLPFAPLYCVVGAYRFIHDDKLWRPIWTQSSKTLKRCMYIVLPLLLILFPITKLYVTVILSRSPFAPSSVHDASLLGISPAFYTTTALVLTQVSAIIEWMLRRQIKKGREVVYDATVRSRGKDASFWGPYTEEWAAPPIERAKRNAEKQRFYSRLASPIVRMLIARVLLHPLSFIPFLNMVAYAAIRALTMGRLLHKPYFAAKKMTPLEVELFVVERQTEYRLFGFTAALLERIPLIGIVFSVSNRIGAAMWAHDLEKQQQMYRSGEKKPTKKYESKTARIEASDLPNDFAGGFPTKKGPARIRSDGAELGKPAAAGTDAKPSLPPRRT